MANFTASAARTSIVPAHFDAWYVKNQTANDPAYHSLGPISQGKFSYKSLSAKDSNGRAHNDATQLEATARMLATGKTNVLKVLDTLGSALTDHIFSGNSFLALSGALTPAGLEFYWKFVCKSGSGNRYIDVRARRLLTVNAGTALFPTDGMPVLGTPAADTLLALDSISENDIIPGGMTSVQIGVGGTGYVNINQIRNSELTIELVLSKEDDNGMGVGIGAKVDFNVEMMQTRTAANGGEISQLDELAKQKSDLKFALKDGTVATFVQGSSSGLGVDWDYQNNGDFNDIQVIKLTGGGIVPLSSLDSIFA